MGTYFKDSNLSFLLNEWITSESGWAVPYRKWSSEAFAVATVHVRGPRGYFKYGCMRISQCCAFGSFWRSNLDQSWRQQQMQLIWLSWMYFRTSASCNLSMEETNRVHLIVHCFLTQAICCAVGCFHCRWNVCEWLSWVHGFEMICLCQNCILVVAHVICIILRVRCTSVYLVPIVVIF